MNGVRLVVLPRQTMTWDQFSNLAPTKAIALDGVVSGGPRWDEDFLRANFDHHDGVVREATMSTAKQILFAIKSGMMERFGGSVTVYVNDPDQDTSFAVWLLRNWKLLTGVQSHPCINRLLELTDRWDITGGAFPMSLNDGLVEQHAWVFAPYSELRKTGALSTASATTIEHCIEAVGARLTRALLNDSGSVPLDTRHEILYASDHFSIVNEIGGTEARYVLFSRGLNAYVSLVATRPDGRRVYTIGRRSRYIDFPVPSLYKELSLAEPELAPWGGSDIIGGSNREKGSGLTPERIREVIEDYLGVGSPLRTFESIMRSDYPCWARKAWRDEFRFYPDADGGRKYDRSNAVVPLADEDRTASDWRRVYLGG